MQGSKRINKVLTNISVQYKNDKYISEDVLRTIPVMKESDNYYVYDTPDNMRLEESLRANGTPANAITWEASTAAYSLSEHALKDKITDRDRENVDKPLSLDKDTVGFVKDRLLSRQDYLSHKLLFTTTTFGNNSTLNTNTSFAYNTTTSSPIQQVLSATSYIIGRAAGPANEAVTNQAIIDALKENVNVYSRIQYVKEAILTPQLLASIFDLDKIHVGTSVYNTAKEGMDATLSSIWGGDFLVAHFDKSPKLKTRTAAVLLRMTKFGNPFLAKKWRDEDISADWVEVSSLYAPKAIATASAYLFKTAGLI